MEFLSFSSCLGFKTTYWFWCILWSIKHLFICPYLAIYKLFCSKTSWEPFASLEQICHVQDMTSFDFPVIESMIITLSCKAISKLFWKKLRFQISLTTSPKWAPLIFRHRSQVKWSVPIPIDIKSSDFIKNQTQC